MGVKTYDPKKVNVILGGAPLSGFGPDTFIQVNRNADSFGLTVGVDGEGARSVDGDESAQVTITLLQTSASNDVLQAFHDQDKLGIGGPLPFAIVDRNGRTLEAAETAWVKRRPDSQYAKAAGTRDWLIETDKLNSFTGGN